MSILENKTFHPFDLWYSEEILSKLPKYRNIETFIINNNPILLYNFKFIPLKMKAFILELDELQRIINFAKSKNALCLELITNYTEKDIEYKSKKLSKSYEATYIIDLRKDIDKLFSNLKNSRRGQIKKAQTEGITIISNLSEEIFLTWWDLYVETVKRGHFVSQKREFIWDLLVNKYCNLFTAWKNNKLLAGAIIVANNYPFYWLGGSSKEYPEYNASSLLHWKIIEYYKNKGYEIYDMGGASLDENHGPTKFKKAFAGELVKITNYSIYLIPFAARVLTFLQNIYYGKLNKPTF